MTAKLLSLDSAIEVIEVHPEALGAYVVAYLKMLAAEVRRLQTVQLELRVDNAKLREQLEKVDDQA